MEIPVTNKKISFLILEGRFNFRQVFHKQVFDCSPNFVLLGVAISELLTKQMLQSLAPNVFMCHHKFVSPELLEMLKPFFEGSDISFIVYGSAIKKIRVTHLVETHLKPKKYKYIKLEEEPTNADMVTFLHDMQEAVVEIRGDYKKEPSKPIGREGEVAKKIIAIGSSTGGPRVVRSILSKVSQKIDAGVVLVQHIPESFSDVLVTSVAQVSSLSVQEAEDGMPICKGNVYVAPGGKHLKVKALPGGGGICVLTDDPPVWSLRPAVDVLMQSLPEVYGDQVIGVILTGIGKDGTAGVKAIKEAGGKTVAQNEETCLIYGMPKSAIESGAIDFVHSYLAMPAVLSLMVAALD